MQFALYGQYTFGVTEVNLAEDVAENYNPPDWDNLSNQGEGFENWIFDTATPNGGFAGNFIGDFSAEINTDDKTFALFANSGNDATSGATRVFPKAMQRTDQFSIKIGVNFRDGAKGFDLRNAENNTVVNFNVGGNEYILAGTTLFGNVYDENTVFEFTFTQNENDVDWTVERSGGETGTQSGTIAGINANTITNIRLYNVSAGTNNDGGSGQRNLFFNDLKFISKYTIPSGEAKSLSVTETSTPAPYVWIKNGAELDLGTNTLSIENDGIVNNLGAFNDPNGTLNFLANGSISGILNLNDVVLNNGGVSFGTTCTINGNLTLNSGSFVNTDSPIYAAGSTLIYNAGSDVTAPYQRRSEWSNADPQGTPYNVILQNNTAVNLGFERKEFDAIMKGNLSIDAGSFMLMDFGSDDMLAPLVVEGDFINNGQISLSGEIGGDLKVFRNFTNNGTFQDNGRALFFEGEEVQELNASTKFEIPFLIIAKTAGEVILNQDMLIFGNGEGLQMSDEAILNLNGNQLQIGNSTNTSVVFNDNSALKGSTTSQILFNSIDASAGTLKFLQTPVNANALAEFEMDGSGGISISDTLNIHDQFILKNGSFASNGNLTLKSSVTKTAIIPEVLGGSISGNIRVERYFSNVNRSFRYVSSPVNSTNNIRANWQEGVNNTGTNYPADNENPYPGYGTHITGSTSGADGFDATLTGNPSMFTWDNTTQAWSGIPNTNATNLIAGQAYALMVRGDRSTDLSSNEAQGGATILRSLGSPEIGTFSIPTSQMPTAAEEFALIGNPYQAQVDVKSISTTGLNTNFMYIWDPTIGDTGGYTAIDLTEDPVTTTPASVANERIQPSQAFFMETSAATSSVTFEENHKTEDIINVETFSTSTPSEIYIGLSEENATSTIDATRVIFGEYYTEEVSFEDAKKLWNNAEYIAISKQNYWLAIEKKPFAQNDTIQLFTGNYFAEDYQLKINLSNVETHKVYLRDRYLDEVIQLENAEYVHPFNIDNAIPESVSTDRFQLILEEIPLSVISEIQPEIKIYPNPVSDEKITIQHHFQKGEEINLSIYDVSGRAIISKTLKVNSNLTTHDVDFLETGVFILQLKNEADVFSQKLIVE